jgi:hypothetical protein
MDIIDLDKNILVKQRSDEKDQQTMLYENLETLTVNIAIASVIIAYARIHMIKFKNNLNF